MSAMISDAAFYGTAPWAPRRRFVMVAGRPREIRTAGQLVGAIRDVIVDRVTSGAGAVTEDELRVVGFDAAEIAEHGPAARDGAARRLRDKVMS